MRIFIGILLLAFVLRAQETLSHNFLFLLDQGRDMMAVKQIVYDHRLTLIGPYTSLGGVFQGPLWYYLLAIPTIIFNGDPWGAVLLMLVISMSVVIVAYLIVKKLAGETSALFTAFLFGVSPEAGAAATFAWNPHPMWLIIVVYICSLYATVYRNPKYQLFLWPVIALSFHFQTAMGVFLLVSTIIFLALFHRNFFKNRYLIYGLLGALLLLSPQILFELRHDFLMTRSILKLASGSSQGLFAGGENYGYVSLVSFHMYELIINFRSAFLHNDASRGLSFLFFIIIFYKLHKGDLLNKEKQFISLCTTVVLIVIVLALIYPYPLRSWFLTGFGGFYLFIVGILLGSLWRTKKGKLLIVCILLLSSLTIIKRIDMLYIHPPDDGGVAKIKGKVDAIDSIYADAYGKQFGLLVFTPPVSTDAYDYLTWWRGNQYGYIPYKEKKGTVYLLMEPDWSKPWSYNGWLETVIKYGQIVQTKKYSSGFVVQKRIF